MKNRKNKPERPRALKRKLMSAVAMLMIATILMATTSYAWFVLSTAPEVTGIETQVGANGSLEIVLLNKDTRADMSTIRAGLGGGSLQENRITANNAWGNLVDLGFTEYGLGELVLLPARLDVSPNGDNYSVDLNKLLAVPSYGFDGRIIELSRDTASAIYQETGFLYSGAQEYGVRAIGTSNTLSAQGSALASAKTNISTYTKSAKTGAQAALSDNAAGLFNIILGYASKTNFDDTHKATLVAMLEELDGVLVYLDAALRQGLVAFAASEVGDVDTFTLVRDRILNTDTPLSALLTDLAEVSTVPETFKTWVNKLSTMQNSLNAASFACDEMTDNDYTWDEIKGVMAHIMNMDNITINGKSVAEAAADISSLMGTNPIEMLLVPGSGLYADIADFTGNYSVSAESMGKTVEMTTASAEKPAYLVGLLAAVNTLEPADGGDDTAALPLDATYGYAIDLAFRCNAAQPDLLLQTQGIQRIYNGGESEEDITSTNGSTQGGGSYMEFSSLDEDFTPEQQKDLMGAIRVGFVDDLGTILGIAQLNTTSSSAEDGVIKAPLYLYDYTFEEDEAGMVLVMGERKLSENMITPLEQNVAKAVTVVVWLDGDIVDNTMVSATKATSLTGVLNLQFATSAELVPSVESSVLEYTPDKSGLEEAVLAMGEIYNAGQGTYTNISWKTFAAAYTRAQSVNENANAGHIEVRHAVNNLQQAALGLEQVNTDAVTSKVEEIRELMGTTDDTARYVITDENGGYIVVDDSYTEEEKASWDVQGTISGVDYAGKNKNDEGNGIYTNIYSDDSWNALANALYQAEAVAMNPNSTENEINAALSALETAEKALTRQVYYAPYEYNGKLYYMAICEKDAADTYGRWYDSNFKRIVSDATILKLNAYAVPATVTQIGQEVLVASDTQYITPDIDFLEEIWPELRDVEAKGVKWNDVDADFFTELMHQYHYDRLSELTSIATTDELLTKWAAENPGGALETSVAAAQALMTKWENTEEVTAADAEAVITALTTDITDTYKTALDHYATAAGATMSANQRILLASYISQAKAVEGYKDATITGLDALRDATTTAEGLLAQSSVTGQAALDALNNLTNELVAAGETHFAKIIHTLPEGFGEDDIVYDVQYPGIQLKLTGKSGTATLGATVLTQDGMVITVTKEITVYDKADGVKLTQLGTDVTSLSLAAGEKAEITAELFYEAGGINTGDKPLAEIVQEKIKSVTWSSEEMKVATVTGTETGTIVAVAAGTVEISISVETEAGNVYTITLPVIVTE